MNGKDVKAKQQEFLMPSVHPYYRDPLVLVRGNGSHVFDSEGRAFLDFFVGILTVSVGHGNPTVTGAVKKQLEELVHTSTLYITEPQVRLAERLAALAPGRLQKSYFTNSGSEANETAVSLARNATGAQDILALRHGYSGRTGVARSLTAHAPYRKSLGTADPGIRHVPAPYCYRCPFGLTYPSCELKCAHDVEEVIQTTTPGQIAGFLAEPVLGVGGFIVPPPGYFEVVEEIVRQYGGLMIIDEVQTGWGRTGEHLFGIQHWDIAPDLMTSAKGLANGLPIGWTIATPEVADAFPGATISTFGGNPVSTTGALATLDVIEDQHLIENAQARGKTLRAGLDDLARRFPAIGEVRGMGLMQGVELVGEGKRPAPELGQKLLEATRKEGLLIGLGGLYGNVLRIAPALTVTDAQVHEALGLIEKAFASVHSEVPTS